MIRLLQLQFQSGLVVGGFIILSLLVAFIILFISLYQKRYYKNLQEKKALHDLFQQQILQSQLEMQEHTFNNISQEIHDNVGQTLSLAKVQLSIIDQQEIINKSMLTDVKESLSKALTDLRDISKSLNSERINSLDLTEMTSNELQRIERLGTLQTNCTIEGDVQQISDQKKLILFRIIQEGIQNILKHSRAKNIKVLFGYHVKDLTIEISDDGIGFDQALLTKKDGLGLRNIVNRAKLIGGTAHIDSAINNGTKILIISPYA